MTLQTSASRFSAIVAMLFLLVSALVSPLAVVSGNAGSGGLSPVLDLYPSNFPHQPENITLMPGPNYVDISWEPTQYEGGSSVIKVHIYYREDPNAQPIVSLGPEARSYRDAGLTPGQEYRYFMRSENKNGIGWWGYGGWAVPGKTHPSAPSDPYAMPRDGRLDLDWSWPSDQGGLPVQGYRVYRANATGDMVIIQQTSYERFADTGLVNGKTYSYSIAAYNQLGEGAASSVTGKPNFAPRNLTASQQDFSDFKEHEVVITWDHPPENHSQITGYVLTGLGPFLDMAVDRNNTSATLIVSSRSVVRLAAIYTDGSISYSDDLWFGGPADGASGGYEWIYCVSVLLLVGAACVITLLFTGRRRKVKGT
jgi:hypothetical protein